MTAQAETATDTLLTRAEVYRLLADALVYPDDVFVERLEGGYPAELLECLTALDASCEAAWSEPFERFARAIDPSASLPTPFGRGPRRAGYTALADLQRAHRFAFGVAASAPPYETEYGQPHAFRQSQELADIVGFYRAFGFDVGGGVRERPDYLGVELEFMYLLACKHAYAAVEGLTEAAEVCHDAQRKFLRDHLARWIGAYARRLNDQAREGDAYAALADLAAAFVGEDARRLGIEYAPLALGDARPTPLGPSLSCMGCAEEDEFSF
jgi:DMSO reductase family type II enzyme chaperone